MIEINLPVNVNTQLLYEELALAFPEWVVANYDPMVNDYPFLFRIESAIREDNTWVQTLYVPDDADLVKLQAVKAAHDPAGDTKEEARNKKVRALVTAIGGMRIQDLTTAQVRSLLAVVIYQLGGVDADMLTIRPIQDWFRPNR